jgi:hypothetical protein
MYITFFHCGPFSDSVPVSYSQQDFAKLSPTALAVYASGKACPSLNFKHYLRLL